MAPSIIRLDDVNITLNADATNIGVMSATSSTSFSHKEDIATTSRPLELVMTNNDYIVIPMIAFVFGFPLLVITVLCVLQKRATYLEKREETTFVNSKKASGSSWTNEYNAGGDLLATDSFLPANHPAHRNGRRQRPGVRGSASAEHFHSIAGTAVKNDRLLSVGCGGAHSHSASATAASGSSRSVSLSSLALCASQENGGGAAFLTDTSFTSPPQEGAGGDEATSTTADRKSTTVSLVGLDMDAVVYQPDQRLSFPSENGGEDQCPPSTERQVLVLSSPGRTHARGGGPSQQMRSILAPFCKPQKKISWGRSNEARGDASASKGKAELITITVTAPV